MDTTRGVSHTSHILHGQTTGTSSLNKNVIKKKLGRFKVITVHRGAFPTNKKKASIIITLR